MDPAKFAQEQRDIWELDYISSSDEEDMDKESDEEDEDEEDSEEEAKGEANEVENGLKLDMGDSKQKVIFDKHAPGQGKTVPFVVRKLKHVQGTKKQQRIVY
jgi:hypothetical protein